MNESSPLAGKPVDESAIHDHVYRIFPNDLNSLGTVFGGLIMATIDRLALVVAERHSGKQCVTASVDALNFLAPAKKGDNLLFKVSVNRCWNTSMEIGAIVIAEDAKSGKKTHIVSSYYTFVALDAEFNPITIPQVIPETSIQKRRFHEAGIRREARLAHRESIKKYRTDLEKE